jgi:uncharacterized membrane protein
MLRRLKKYFFSGLAVFLPVVLTIYISVLILNFAESILGKYLKPFLLEYYDFYFWGLGILILFLLIVLSGFLITNYFGRTIHRSAEHLLLSIPLMSNIYPAFKEIAKFVFREETNGKRLEQVVLLQWPRPGVYTIGFITNATTAEICQKAGRDLVNVLVPTVPNPLTGMIAMVPHEELIVLNLSVEDAVKIIVSGGVVDPKALPIANDSEQT